MADSVGAANNNSGETVAVPSSAQTDSVNLAWSRSNDIQEMPAGPPAAGGRREEPADEPRTARQSWGTALSRAASMLLICLALAAVILVGSWALNRSSNQATEPARTTAAPGSASTSTTPTTLASTPDQDARFMTSLTEKGIEFNEPASAVVANAKVVCQNLDSAMTVQQIVAQFKSTSPKVADHAEDFVAISVRAYCPQYSKLVAAI